jgi:regulator of sigma E protease
MIDIIQSILAFIVALGILITFHEYGHFWVARRFDVKILRFSIGFGRPLYTRRFGVDQSEFVIAALPLGGYVKMLDEREGEVDEQEIHRAFNTKPLAQRFLIVLAGPVFNFIFAIAAYWLIYMIGIEGLKPLIESVEEHSIAEAAGFRAGQEIRKVDDIRTPTWFSVIDVTVNKVVDANDVVFTVSENSENEIDLVLDMSEVSIDDMAGGRLLNTIGWVPIRPRLPAIIGDIIAGSAADHAGLEIGDKIIAANGQTVTSWEVLVNIIRSHPDEAFEVELIRAGEQYTLALRPAPITDKNGETIGRIGAAVDQQPDVFKAYVAKESYYPHTALIKAVGKTWDVSLLTLRILGKMILGEASVKNLSGPISIARYAGNSADIGLVAFLGFLSIVSISLGVLNLLPVPLLDGGHLMYYLIEFVKGSPVSESVQLVGQQVGIFLLFGLMGLAFYNDIIRLIG